MKIDKKLIKRYGLITLFSGAKEDDIYHLELDDYVDIGDEDSAITSFSLAQEGREFYISANLSWSGYFTYNVNTDKIEKHFM